MLIQMKHPSTIQDPFTIMAVMDTCKDGSILVWGSLHLQFLITMQLMDKTVGLDFMACS